MCEAHVKTLILIGYVNNMTSLEYGECPHKPSSASICLKEDAQACLKYGNKTQRLIPFSGNPKMFPFKGTLTQSYGVDTIGTLIPTTPYCRSNCSELDAFLTFSSSKPNAYSISNSYSNAVSTINQTSCYLFCRIWVHVSTNLSRNTVYQELFACSCREREKGQCSHLKLQA